ncbi:hypothetical protein [Nonomuraea roseoviolacea]|uniref:hypothetical protein n=1 Tax=Nonomuraea roseoviolacea TaxID=103837 RepID=UPI0031E06596
MLIGKGTSEVQQHPLRVRSFAMDGEVNEYGDDELLALLDNGATVQRPDRRPTPERRR